VLFLTVENVFLSSSRPRYLDYYIEAVFTEQLLSLKHTTNIALKIIVKF
jgi:hypothetical protein